ncbi:AIM24 family protein [Streptacidiphilus sp. 4-A2]|nr:AIM24 family protein [Streptacidiphilus sp. 4-A2]
MRADIKGSVLPVLEIQLEDKESVVSCTASCPWMTANVHMSQTTQGAAVCSGRSSARWRRRHIPDPVPVQGRRGAGGLRREGPRAHSAGGHRPRRHFLVHRHGWLAGRPGSAPAWVPALLPRRPVGRRRLCAAEAGGAGPGLGRALRELNLYNLAPGQTMLVHPGHVGMFEDSVSFKITTVPGSPTRSSAATATTWWR